MSGRHEIEYNGTTGIRYEFADEIGDVKACKVAVYNRSGSELLAATSATVTNVGAATAYSWKAILTNAMAAGDYTATLNATPDTIYTGDLYRIGNDTSAQDTLRVESYNSTTRVVTFSDYCRHAHAAGEYLKPRFATYNLVTTTVATWTAGLDLTFVWTPYSDGAASTSPYMPGSELGRILKRSALDGGLEHAFRLRYRQYAEMLGDGDFATMADDAYQEIADLFAARGMDLGKVVDNHTLHELRLVQIAYALAYGLGTSFVEERAALKERRLELINALAALPVWVDADQDLIESDDEVQTYERPYPRRRLY